MASPKGIPFGNYLLQRKLGEGGMAEVFLAEERGQSLRRRVVLKRILPSLADRQEFVTMFLHEARVAARCSHPNVVHLYNFGCIDGSYFIAMEFVDGPSAAQLGRIARTRGGIPIRYVLRIVSDIAAGLHHAHNITDEDGTPLNLIHRDVSPQNILISSGGVAKLVDFGVARSAQQEQQTHAGTIKGKLAYLPPELYEGRDLDRGVDIFALGCVLYALFRGHSPFRRDNDAATVHAVLADPVPPLAPLGLPPEIDRIIAKATAKDRAQRYATALEMQEQIEKAAAALDVTANTFQLAAYVREVIEAWRGGATDGAEAPDGSTIVLEEDAFEDVDLSTLAASDSRSVPMMASGLPRTLTPSGQVAVPAKGATAVPAAAAPAGTRGRLARWIASLAALAAFVAGGLFVWQGFGPPPDVEAPAARAAHEGPPAPPEGPVTLEVPSEERTQAGADAGAAEPPMQLVAYLAVDSVPPGATIELDGQELGAAPLAGLEVAPGGHTLVARLAGHRDARQEVQLEVGQRYSLELRLHPLEARAAPAGRGRLWVDSRPWSKVAVAGRSLGYTPVTGAELPAGRHVLVLQEENGDRHRYRVTIRPGAPTKVFINLRTGEVHQR